MRGEIFSKKYKHGAHVDIEKHRLAVRRARMKHVEVTRVKLDRGGYTKNGKYYGTGEPVFDIYDDKLGNYHTVRAKDRADALKKAYRFVMAGDELARSTREIETRYSVTRGR